MKRVVADTNVLVSALQFGGKPKQLLDLAIDGQVDLAVSEAIIAETLRGLRDKFDRAPEWVAETERQLPVISRLVQPTESIQVIEADPTDDRILECALGEMLKIQNRHVLWDTHQISIPAAHAKDAEARRIPFEPSGRLAQLLKRRRFLGPNAYVFGDAAGRYQGTIRTAWESLVLLANRIEPKRTRAHGRVNREKLAEIDLHWHDLRHEAACRWLAKGLDLRAIQLLLGHADLKTTQRYLNVTDEELRKTMAEKLWKRR